VTGHTNPTDPTYPPARYTDCSAVVHDLTSVTDLTGKQVTHFEILSDTPFTVTLTVTATWEHIFDFTISAYSDWWSIYNDAYPVGGHYEAGVGYINDSDSGHQELTLQCRDFGVPNIMDITTYGTPGTDGNRFGQARLSGSIVASVQQYTLPATVNVGNNPIDNIKIVHGRVGNNPVISKVVVFGTGANPWLEVS
jgi:hypothetical protein